jgi:hypothetical protein
MAATPSPLIAGERRGGNGISATTPERRNARVGPE